jgi:hypothetical protein
MPGLEEELATIREQKEKSWTRRLVPEFFRTSTVSEPLEPPSRLFKVRARVQRWGS